MPTIGPFELLVIIAMICWVPAIIICFMKGLWIFGLLGVPVFVLAFVGALMPAKPGSYWDRRAARAP